MGKKLQLVIDDEHGLNASDRADVIPPEGFEEALDEAYVGCSKFVFSAFEVQIRAMKAERKLERMGLPKAMRNGFELRLHPAGPVAKAYKWSAKSIDIILRRTAKGWVLAGTEANRVFPAASEKVKLIAPNVEIVEEIKRRAVADIAVKQAT